MAAAADPAEYFGTVKSYNERRGFGFVACTESALKYGRDVYISKAEVQFIPMEVAVPHHTPHYDQHGLCMGGAKPILVEEDFIRFHVKVSAGGFPQAERIERMRKFQGVVLQPPVQPGAVVEASPLGKVASDELRGAAGHGEVLLDRESCGHALLTTGDRVHFCVKDPILPGAAPEALLAVLVERHPQSAGSILACFVLRLPRLPTFKGVPRPDLVLDVHSLDDRLILAGLAPDTDETELMRFFGKHGAVGATVAYAQAGAFAAVTFQTFGDVARLVGRTIHTFGDDKETRTASLFTQCASDCLRLPGLRAPSLESCNEPGVLLVRWSPVILAASYMVEIRAAGMQEAWSAVEAPAGQQAASTSPVKCFGRHCSSCRITGLPQNVMFEARVTYYTSCCCRADASEASAWCFACPAAAPMAHPSLLASHASMQSPVQLGVAGSSAIAGLHGCANPSPCVAAPHPAFLAAGMGVWHAAASAGLGPLAADSTQQMCPRGFASTPACSWRCVHGCVNPPPSMPELHFADPTGSTIVVRWPSMSHAAAYVVELQSAQLKERFFRTVPAQDLGLLVELTICGLKPLAWPQGYSAQVRCLSACGCESEASPAGVLQAGAVTLPPMPVVQQPVCGYDMREGHFASTLPPQASPPQQAPMIPPQMQPAPQYEAAAPAQQAIPVPPEMPPVLAGAPIADCARRSSEKAKHCFRQPPQSLPMCARAETQKGMLPSLLGSRVPIAPPPSGPAWRHVEPLKESLPESPPEIAGNEEEEDCIILD